MRKCDSCGKLYQENKDIFCPHCGAVAQKQCTHGSSFDSDRYDRGEIYKNNNTQYQDTTYNNGFEPHAQRENPPYNKYEDNGGFGEKIPSIKLPDFTKMLSKGQSSKGKPIGIIFFVVIIAFNAITALVGFNGATEDTGLWEDISEIYVDEDINDLYTVVDKATIEVSDTDGAFTSFTLEINGMVFEDFLSQNLQEDIDSGLMADEITSQNTFVEMIICDFSKDIVPEETYNNVLDNGYYCTGNQVEGKCKYEFFYDFEYDKIVHIGSGVSFYLDNGMYINAELPFSAFSVSEKGEITYYTSYADSDTAWNTVFTECSNEQDISSDAVIDFAVGEKNYGK